MSEERNDNASSEGAERQRSQRWSSARSDRRDAPRRDGSRDQRRGDDTYRSDRRDESRGEGQRRGDGFRESSRGASRGDDRRGGYGDRGGYGRFDDRGSRDDKRRGGFDRREDRGGARRGESQEDRGGYRRQDSRDGERRFGRRDGGFSREAQGERGGYGRREDREYQGRRDDRPQRGGYGNRDERNGRGGYGGRDDRGGHGRRDERSDRGGYGRRDERSERGGYRGREDRGGYGRRDERGGFRERGDRGGPSGRDGERRGFGDRDGARSGGRSVGSSDRGRGFDSRDRRDGFERGGRDGGRDSGRGFERRGGFDGRGDRGAGWSDEQSQIRGPRSWDAKATGDERPRRRPEPMLPEEITGYELDKSVRQQLRTLSKDNAEGVARHLVAAAELLEENPEKALDHAQHAVSRAGRVPAAREALGLVLYRTGEYAEALREFRTARRLSGSDHLLPYMVDCERGLGRYERALELANSPEAQRLPEADNIELAIVVSGVRRDMGQARAAVVGLRLPALQRATTQPWAARLFYAYADALMDLGESDEAREWFVKADEADRDGETDAGDRIDQIDGFELTDLTPEDEDEQDPRLAEIDLSEYGAVQPQRPEATSVEPSETSVDGAANERAVSDDIIESAAPEAESSGERTVPRATFDDGSSRG
ncbi:hypothetical protein DEAB109302_02930 [Dermacoccus abyssi]